MVAVVLMAGDHVPVMPSILLAGKVKTVPLHNGPIGANVGVALGVTKTVSLTTNVVQLFTTQL